MKQNIVTKCSRKKTEKIGSILSTYSPAKGEIAQPGSAVSDLLASLGIWVAPACFTPCPPLPSWCLSLGLVEKQIR